MSEQEKTKIEWTEKRTQEISQYYCEKCEECFRFEDDEDRDPKFCPICGRLAKTGF